MATTIPDNDASFDVFEVAAATGGRIVREGSGAPSSSVFGDSRRVRGGTLYVALAGERFDGHDFAVGAADAGAGSFLIAESKAAALAPKLPDAAGIVAVPDTLVAWGNLARAHVAEWRRPARPCSVVAITGTAGKTTTKELCAAILREIAPTWSTPGNLNNLVGVPATLFALTKAHKFAVIEVGMSVPGEIARLARIVRPGTALLLNVGLGHAGGVGGTRGDVAREKGALVENAGHAILNADDPAAVAQRHRMVRGWACTFGRSASADCRLATRVPIDGGSLVTIEQGGHHGALAFDVELPIPGEAAAMDLVAAFHTAWHVAYGDLTPEIVRKGIARLETPAGRANVKRAGGVTIVDDTYNANPESFRAALVTIAEIAAGGADGPRPIVLVVGEMKELGDASAAAHAALGAAISAMLPRPALVVGCGGALVDHTLEGVRAAGIDAIAAGSAAEAAVVVGGRVRPGDVVLVKASRSVGAEVVVDAVMKGAEARA